MTLSVPQLLYFSLYLNYYNDLKRNIVNIEERATSIQIIEIAKQSDKPLYFSMLSDSIWHNEVICPSDNYLQILLSTVQIGLPIIDKNFPKRLIVKEKLIENYEKLVKTSNTAPNEITKLRSLLLFLNSLDHNQLKILCFMLNLDEWEKHAYSYEMENREFWYKTHFVFSIADALSNRRHTIWLNSEKTLCIKLPVLLLDQYKKIDDAPVVISWH